MMFKMRPVITILTVCVDIINCENIVFYEVFLSVCVVSRSQEERMEKTHTQQEEVWERSSHRLVPRTQFPPLVFSTHFIRMKNDCCCWLVCVCVRSFTLAVSIN